MPVPSPKQSIGDLEDAAAFNVIGFEVIEGLVGLVEGVGGCVGRAGHRVAALGGDPV
jgi:hypothetical protein